MAKILGVFEQKKKICIVQEVVKNRKKVLVVQKGHSALKKDQKDFKIYRGTKLEDLRKISDLRFTNCQRESFLFYRVQSGKTKKLCFAISKDLAKWKYVSEFKVGSSAVAVDKKFAFVGLGSGIGLIKKDKKGWSVNAEIVLKPRHNFFDFGEINVAQVVKNSLGIYVFYITTHNRGGFEAHDIGLAKFDKNNPHRLISRSEIPLWEQPEGWDKQIISFVGITQIANELKMYWTTKKGELLEVFHPEWSELENFLKSVHFKLKRHHKNPVIVPHGKNTWETKATFNPAAVYLDGKVHLLYRAIGDNDVSVLGYAASEDGYNFNLRLDEPAYIPRAEFEGRPAGSLPTYKPISNSPFESGGGGWGGCEDPRITHIGDRIYLTYVAYSGWSEPRVALSSISVEDFLNQNWNWEEPVLISKPGEINKNACILPEKVNGKYVIFHRVYPDLLIDYVDDLNFDGKTKFIKTVAKIKPRRNYWDSRKIGIGPPPIKTPYGWLVIYQGVGEQDPGRYKIGAMLLDLNDPAKVVARAAKPILEPEEHYENGGWKFGVVYPCGAVVIGDKLFVYYGGADAYVGVAAADLDEFLKNLVGKKSPKVEKISSVMISK